jgi:hypothetical protein
MMMRVNCPEDSILKGLNSEEKGRLEGAKDTPVEECPEP